MIMAAALSMSVPVDDGLEQAWGRAGGRWVTVEPAPPMQPLATGLAVAVCTYKRAESLKRFLESLNTQDRRPDQLIVVDASPSDETDRMLRGYQDLDRTADSVSYFRVSGPLRGLTRQRNFGLRWVTGDLVAFFDDDVVLMPGCLRELERVHRVFGNTVAGVGALVQNRSRRILFRWKVMRLLRMVPDLLPGRYQRSGISTPWAFLPPTEEPVEGDWLPGCAMVWKTAIAREVGFDEHLRDVATSEDLDFSLRARRRGKLLLAGAARVHHFQDPRGRPEPYKLGYEEIRIRYRLHRRALADRSWRDAAWFWYAWFVETLLLMLYLLYPRESVWTFKYISGRVKGALDIVFGSGAT